MSVILPISVSFLLDFFLLIIFSHIFQDIYTQIFLIYVVDRYDARLRAILVDSSEENVEKISFSHLGLEGYDISELAKFRLETVCEGVVSCSDIVALAAHDVRNFHGIIEFSISIFNQSILMDECVTTYDSMHCRQMGLTKRSRAAEWMAGFQTQTTLQRCSTWTTPSLC